MSNITIQGLIDDSLNGEYFIIGIHDGYPLYKNENDSLIIYKKEYGPYRFDPA